MGRPVHGGILSIRHVVCAVRTVSDRALRVLLSVAMLAIYLQFNLVRPALVTAAPAALSVSATVSA